MKKPLTELQKSLNYIDSLAKNIKIKLTMNRDLRNWYDMARVGFGQKNEHLKSVGTINNINKDVDYYANLLKTQIKEKENCKYQIGDKELVSTPVILPTENRMDTVETIPTERASKYPFIPKFPDQTVELLTQKSHGCDQVNTARILWERAVDQHFTGQLLVAQAGAGKTFVLGSFIKNFLHYGFTDNCLSPWPVLYVSKASVVEQTKGVLTEKFGLDCINTVHVINIEMLRGALLGILIEEDIKIQGGIEYPSYKWRPCYKPALILWDESQNLAREDSVQSKIANSLYDEEKELKNSLSWDTLCIDASATPASTVAQFKHFALSTKRIINFNGLDIPLTPNNWNSWSQLIASPSSPYDHCTAAVRRFVDEMEPWIVRISNIRPKHKCYNSVNRIHFQTKEEKEEYEKAEEKHHKKQQEIEADDELSGSQRTFALLAQFTIFRKAAENCRRYHIAKWIHDTYNAGKSPALGFCFKQTGTNVIRILIEDYNWRRDDISIIWGGATETLNAKKKLAKKYKEDEKFRSLFEEMDMDIEEMFKLDLSDYVIKTAEDLKFEKDNDLITQKPKDRERERIRFQKGKSKVCMFSYKSGGVGLSLHHEPDYAKLTRPREGLFTPVYSEKELVQALGRLPRITSVSDTFQTMCYYAHTIEEHVAARVSQKLKCLKEVVKAHESWESVILGSHLAKEMDQYRALTDASDEVEMGGELLGEFIEERK